MRRRIDLNPEQRAALLDRYRKDRDPEVRFRSHILLLLDDGHSWVTLDFPTKNEHRVNGYPVRSYSTGDR